MHCHESFRLIWGLDPSFSFKRNMEGGHGREVKKCNTGSTADVGPGGTGGKVFGATSLEKIGLRENSALSRFYTCFPVGRAKKGSMRGLWRAACGFET